MGARSPGEWLAMADTSLAAVSLACVLLGYRAIRRKQVARHRALMMGAAASSLVVLLLFGGRFVRYGFRPAGGDGVRKVVSTAILLAHEPPAVINVPLVVCALILGLTSSRAHPEVARWALPIWIYVLVTGIALYFARHT